jgi:hypothetical protein
MEVAGASVRVEQEHFSFPPFFLCFRAIFCLFVFLFIRSSASSLWPRAYPQLFSL